MATEAVESFGPIFLSSGQLGSSSTRDLMQPAGPLNRPRGHGPQAPKPRAWWSLAAVEETSLMNPSCFQVFLPCTNWVLSQTVHYLNKEEPCIRCRLTCANLLPALLIDGPLGRGEMDIRRSTCVDMKCLP